MVSTSCLTVSQPMNRDCALPSESIACDLMMLTDTIADKRINLPVPGKNGRGGG